MDVIGALSSRLRRYYLMARGVHFAGSAWLRAIEVPRNHRALYLGEAVALDRGCTLLMLDRGELHFGARCYVNRYTMFAAAGRLEIGARSMIGPFCFITDHDHTPGDPQGGTLITQPTQLGADCWLGAQVSVLKGVTIGDGAIIGAGSVVTKSIPARVVAAGNPARILRSLP